jgi:hypothetical protein
MSILIPRHLRRLRSNVAKISELCKKVSSTWKEKHKRKKFWKSKDSR